MKNHELLDLIGEVNEDYVQAADIHVVQPRFPWKPLAACAACAALVLGGYSIYRAANPPLHSYIVMEGGALTTYQGESGPVKAPESGADDTNGPVHDFAPTYNVAIEDGLADIGGEPVYNEQGDAGSGIDGAYYGPGQDAPMQEKAAAQYDNFVKSSGLTGSADWLPEWCGGLWIDNSYFPEARLTVAVVKEFRTPELEAQVQEWCGGEVEFKDVKYSWSHLDGLMGPVGEVLNGKAPDGACFGFGVDVIENRLTVDVYGGGISNEVLAGLARLDPEGDAVLVRVFPDALSVMDEVEKAPGPEPNEEAIPGGAWVESDSDDQGLTEAAERIKEAD